MTADENAATAPPRSERVSAFKMIPPVWSSSSRTAGCPRPGSTMAISTLGTSSGRSPVGASPAGHRRAGATTPLRESPRAQYGPCQPWA
jgi:hypothetical protein